MRTSSLPDAALSLAEWASIAGIVGTLGGLVGLAFVGYQLYVGNKERQSQIQSLRTQATMLFQERFKESQAERGLVFREFPIHVSLLATMQEIHPDAVAPSPVLSWEDLDELSDEQQRQAKQVVNAFNDVAQYVVDGLELRSALQQYHLPIMRAGALLNPYLAELNAERNGRRALRIGRRIPVLYNAALAYHRCHHKHSGREVGLVRPAPVKGEKDLDLIFFDGDRGGVQQFECFHDTPDESLLLPDHNLTHVIAAAEEKLRQ